jgi:hypothetical protein
VTYRRGALTCPLAATFGRSLLLVGDEHGGSRVERTEKDFVFAAADLVLAGQPAEPARGDQILEPQDPAAPGPVLVWEILAPAGEAPWRYHDGFRATVRVHAKYVRRE